MKSLKNNTKTNRCHVIPTKEDWTLDHVKKIAKTECRSLNKQILMFLKEAVERYDNQKI